MQIRKLVIGSCFALLATACGGGESNDETAEPVTEGTAPAETDGTAATTTSAASDTADSTTTTTTSTTTTTTTTTTVPAAPPLPEVAAGDIPDLVVAWGAGTDAPLDLAQRLIGFPLPISPPDGAVASDVDLRLRGDAEQWRWSWFYGALTPPGSVGDIDAELPEGGPGTIEGRLYYDPLFEALGWRNVGQVISDPSSGGGGPQSVNWAYADDDGVFLIGDLEVEPSTARAWVDEDLGFGPTEGTPGHRIDFDVLTAPGVVPVPLIQTLLDELPAVDGTFSDVWVRTAARPEDSFDAAEGLRYLEIELEWTLAATSPDAAGAAYLASLPTSILQEGEESFFDEGVIEIREPQVGGALADWQQSVILLDRYPGTISMDTEDDGSVTATLDVRLEPNREVLQPPAG